MSERRERELEDNRAAPAIVSASVAKLARADSDAGSRAVGGGTPAGLRDEQP